MGNASSIGIAACAKRCERSSPSTSSITNAYRASGFLEPVNRRNVRMVQRREHLRFAREAREAVGVLREGIWQHLDRTCRRRLVSVARYTAPTPSSPIWAVIS